MVSVGVFQSVCEVLDLVLIDQSEIIDRDGDLADPLMVDSVFRLAVAEESLTVAVN